MADKDGSAAASLPIQGEEALMSRKSDAFGTMALFQSGLRYGVDEAKAKQICGFNRHYAEHSGYVRL